MNVFEFYVTIIFFALIIFTNITYSKLTLAQTSIIASKLSDSAENSVSESQVYLTINSSTNLNEILYREANYLDLDLVNLQVSERVKKNDASNLLNNKHKHLSQKLKKNTPNYLDVNKSLIAALKQDDKLNQSESTVNVFEYNKSKEYRLTQVSEIENLSQFIIADIIPIENYQIKPPKEDQLEEKTGQDSIKIPVINQPEKQPNNFQEQQNLQKQIILNSLSVSAFKYPWIVNPNDNFTFATQFFQPNTKENYIDIEINFTKDNPLINQFIFSSYPKENQFYWILNDNKVVIETKGYQGGFLYQGKDTQIISIQEVTSSQAFSGLQSVFNIPVALENLSGEIPLEEQDFSVTSVAGEIINPEGIPAGQVIINSGIDKDNPNVRVIENISASIGSASSNGSNGGGELFDNIDATNSPKILQGYPTTNIQPLLGEGEVALTEGEIIPKSALESAGIFWGNILTGEGFGFSAPISSNPGIKVAQEDKFDNPDLLNMLVNPFLSKGERDIHYLNSLLWVPLGRRQPQFRILSETEEKRDWYRFFTSYSHNRSIIQYDKTKISATYSNLFSNNGFSLTTSFNDGKIDAIQTLNSTFGMLLATIFENIRVGKIDDSLQNARDKFNSRQSFDSLKTTATPAQRTQINQRLNRTLSYTKLSSNLEQISGSYTFPSKITPNSSTIFQIRTGNHQRAVQFVGQKANIIREGDTFFSDLRLSNQRFGPLTYVGAAIPLNQTGIQPINESSAVEVILTNARGEQFVQQFSSADNTSVPINARAADLAFDYMELTRIDDVRFKWDFFNGYLSLPTIELLTAGTSGNFNYGASLGTWFNINSDSAPGVDNNNNLGIQEPTIGIYTNVLLDYVKRNVELDSEKKPVALNTHASSLRISHNSASDRNNPFSTFLNYYFERQEKNFGYSIFPSLAFIQDNSNGELLGILSGEYSTSKGLNLKASFEIGKTVFYSFEGLQRINDSFSAGIYLKNYRK